MNPRDIAGNTEEVPVVNVLIAVGKATDAACQGSEHSCVIPVT